MLKIKRLFVFIILLISIFTGSIAPVKQNFVKAEKSEICAGEAMVTMEASTKRILYSKNENIQHITIC